MIPDRGRRRRRGSRLCLLAASLSFVLLHRPSDGLTEQDTATERPSFRASTRSVLLQVSVLDGAGLPVRGLEPSHFSIYEDGVLQEITHFEHDAAMDVGSTGIIVLIDTSSSMRGPELVQARNAALRFLRDAPAHAEIAILAFDHELSVVHEFTRDRPALAEAVHRLEPGGGTALYQGVLDAVDRLDNANRRRRLLVVLSDGKDLDSGERFADVARRLVSSAVVIHAVGLYPPRERELFVGAGQFYKAPPLDVNLNPAWVLTEIARISGGVAYFPKASVELEPLFSEIARGVQLQYLIAYAPPPADGAPRFREIRVRVRRGPTDRLTVRARRGYVR